MKIRFFGLCTAIMIFLAGFGCTLPSDPPFINNKTITLLSNSVDNLSISWYPAGDDFTKPEDLVYQIYLSKTSNLSTSKILENETPYFSGNTEILGRITMEYSFSGLEQGQAYFINVGVKDFSGNLVAYDSIEVSTYFSTEWNLAYNDPDPQIYHYRNSGDSGKELEIAIDIQSSNPKDVFFVVSNYGDVKQVVPTITDFASVSMTSADATRSAARLELREQPRIGRNDISEFNHRSLSDITSFPDINRSFAPEKRYAVSDAVNDTQVFYESGSYEDYETQATCRLVRTVTDTAFGAKTLNIWVGDDVWWDGGSGGKHALVTEEMILAVADAFLVAGEGNDIFDWGTTIYGSEWGDHLFNSQMIQPDNNITILISDIDNDNLLGGTVAGYFYSKDNYRDIEENSYILAGSRSNERVMFYLDAVLLAYVDDYEGNWDIYDSGPAYQISTLAHELQHMIHYYEHRVKRNAPSPVWIDEMCSLIMEDFLADKMMLMGPRGVAYNVPGPGSENNSNGWLPSYLNSNKEDLFDFSYENFLASYSLAYSFGSWLTRNYGGAGLARNLVQNSEYAGEAILTDAISNTVQENLQFRELISQWGAAVLLSDLEVSDPGYRLNQGSSWFTSLAGGQTYNLGGINYYNYRSNGTTGPQILSAADHYNLTSFNPHSNLFYQPLAAVTGQHTLTVGIPVNTDLTVIIRSPR